MARPTTTEFNPFFEGYIQKTTGKNLAELRINHHSTLINFWETVPMDKINHSYAEGKWTIKQIFQHIIDTERIMTYRALSIARGEKNGLLPFEEDEYVANSSIDHREWSDMIKEWKNLRTSTYDFFKSLGEKDYIKSGMVGKNSLSVNAILFILFGHPLHHIEIIQNRYL